MSSPLPHEDLGAAWRAARPRAAGHHLDSAASSRQSSRALEALAENEASGRAEVVVRDDGTRVLQVQLDAPARDDSFYEIWLIDRDVVGMFPLGAVRPGTQTVPLPAGLDLDEYPIVDVSVEPLDGDPTHSGVSVARGELES